MQKLSLALLALAATLAAGGETTPEVPEPSTYLMIAAGVGALAIARYRKTRKK
jgi:hypothetical protein